MFKANASHTQEFRQREVGVEKEGEKDRERGGVEKEGGREEVGG